MKLRKALSLTALLAGAGLGWAQELPTDAATVQTGKPATLMDTFRKRSTGPEVQPAAQPVEPSRTTTMAAGSSTTGMIPSQCELATGGNGGCTFYGSAEYMLLKMGDTFRSVGVNHFPSIRSDMPYTFLARTLFFNAADHGVLATDGPGGPNQAITLNVTQFFGKVTLQPTLFDGSNLDSGDRNAFRLTVGMYLDAGRELAVEARFFELEKHPSSFTALASGDIPFNPGQDIVEQPVTPNSAPPARPAPISQSGQFTANFSAQITGVNSNRLLGFDVNAVKQCVNIGTVNFQGVGGVCYLEFNEAQHLEQSLGMVSGNRIIRFVDGVFDVPETNFTNLVNNSVTRNNFYGAQAGGRFEGTCGNVFFNGTGLVAVGGMRQTTRYSESVTNPPNDLSIPTTTYPQPAQLEQTRTRLTFVPQVQGNVGYAFTDCIRGFVGYNVLFIRRVVRPVNGGLPVSADGTITLAGPTTAIRGPALTNFTEENLVVHGWNFGVEFRY